MNNNITQFGKNTAVPKKGRGTSTEIHSDAGIAHHGTDHQPNHQSEQRRQNDKRSRRYSFDDNAGGYMGL